MKQLKIKIQAYKEFIQATEGIVDPQIFLVFISYNGVSENDNYKELQATQVNANSFLKD